jgi:hypothetical protein
MSGLGDRSGRCSAPPLTESEASCDGRGEEHKSEAVAEGGIQHSRHTLARVAVLARAKAAANAVKPRPEPWVLVTESARRSWSGLPPWDD